MKDDIRVLVVDDEEVLRNLLQRILTGEGHSVTVAHSGKKALEMLAESPVDIVISDIKMPEMDGFELLKAVKKDYPDVGVIMMTAYADSYSVKDALMLGADDYITKPFKSFEICLIVERSYWRRLSSKVARDEQPI